MSFIRILYRKLIPEEVKFKLGDIPKVLDFIRDITSGKYLSVIEKHEFEKFLLLAMRIDEKAELLPHVVDLLNGKTGPEIKQALLEHRVLVHSLFYNKTHVLNQLSKIIDELENQVCIQEFTHNQGYRVIKVPEVLPERRQ